MFLLYFILCHCTSIMMFVSAYFILKRTEDSDCRVLSFSFMVLGTIFLTRAITLYFDVGVTPGNSLNSILVGQLTTITYSLYPLRKTYPRALGGWRIMLLYLPFIIAILVIYIVMRIGYRFPPFDTFSLFTPGNQIQFDQLFRALMVMTSLIYGLFPAIACYKHKQVNIVRIISLLIIFPASFIVIFFMMPAQVYYVVTLYQIWVLFYVILTTNLVLVRKLGEDALDDDKQSLELSSPEKLWRNLEEVMHSGEPWRNPDLKLNDLARMVGSNRTTISDLIHSKGYATFHDYVARYRVSAFCDFATKNKVENINKLLTEVGFRSNSTAFKYFKGNLCMTPSQYLKATSAPKSASTSALANHLSARKSNSYPPPRDFGK